MMNEEQTNSRNPGVRVLVVDSDFLGRHLVGRFLTVKGFQTALASSGDDALHKLDGTHFDLLVSNVDMPDMNGIQLLRMLRIRHPSLPVILMTTLYDETLRELVMAWGASELLRKPLVEGQLLNAVSAALQGVAMTPAEEPVAA